MSVTQVIGMSSGARSHGTFGGSIAIDLEIVGAPPPVAYGDRPPGSGGGAPTISAYLVHTQNRPPTGFVSPISVSPM